MHPLSRFAPSPSFAARERVEALAAGRPWLGVLGIGRRQWHGAGVVRGAMDNGKEPCNV